MQREVSRLSLGGVACRWRAKNAHLRGKLDHHGVAGNRKDTLVDAAAHTTSEKSSYGLAGARSLGMTPRQPSHEMGTGLAQRTPHAAGAV